MTFIYFNLGILFAGDLIARTYLILHNDLGVALAWRPGRRGDWLPLLIYLHSIIV